MAAPQVADSGGADGGSAPDSPSEPGPDTDESGIEEAEDIASSNSPADEPTIEEADLDDDDFADGDGLFTGVEETDDEDGSESSSDQDGDDEDVDDDVLDGLDSRGEALEGSINDGFARLAVVNLDDDDQDDLEDEFKETFEAFRFGYFGAKVVEDYVLVDESDEIDPFWGFLGAAMICTAMVVWMRPDSDEIVERTKDVVGNIAGGDGL